MATKTKGWSDIKKIEKIEGEIGKLLEDYCESFNEVFAGERKAYFISVKPEEESYQDCTYYFYIEREVNATSRYELFSVYQKNIYKNEGMLVTDHLDPKKDSVAEKHGLKYKTPFKSKEELDDLITKHIEFNREWQALIASLKRDS